MQWNARYVVCTCIATVKIRIRMQQYATNACVCIKNRHTAYTEGNGAYAYARVGTSIYIAAVCIKKLLSRQVYATKEEYAYVCTCIEPYATGHKPHAIRAQTALISRVGS